MSLIYTHYTYIYHNIYINNIIYEIRTKPAHLVKVLYQYLHNNVLELDVHHGRHRLLLGPHQRGTEDHAQVGHRHQVVLALGGDPVADTTTRTELEQRHES